MSNHWCSYSKCRFTKKQLVRFLGLPACHFYFGKARYASCTKQTHYSCHGLNLEVNHCCCHSVTKIKNFNFKKNLFNFDLNWANNVRVHQDNISHKEMWPLTEKYVHFASGSIKYLHQLKDQLSYALMQEMQDYKK